MPEATPADVEDVIDTKLETDTIQAELDLVARDIDREYGEGTGDTEGVEFDDLDHRLDFEAVLTAFRLVSGRDRRVTSMALGDASKSYEGSDLRRLRGRVSRLDPGDEFSLGVVRDTERSFTAVDVGGDR